MVCLTPVVIAAWPSIVSYVAGAAAALGFTAVSSVDREKVDVEVETVEVELEDSSVLEGYMGEERQFIKDGVTLTVRTNEHGRLVLYAKGNESKETLQWKALAFAGKLQQTYSYHKAMTQLRQSGFNVVDERVEQDEEIHITLRRW
jgi:hypothetical protein